MLSDCPYCTGSGRMIDRVVFARNEETGFEIASDEFETDCIACDGSGKVDVPDDFGSEDYSDFEYDESL